MRTDITPNELNASKIMIMNYAHVFCFLCTVEYKFALALHAFFTSVVVQCDMNQNYGY